MSNSGPSPRASRHGKAGWYKSQRRPTGRFFSRIPSWGEAGCGAEEQGQSREEEREVGEPRDLD